MGTFLDRLRRSAEVDGGAKDGELEAVLARGRTLLSDRERLRVAIGNCETELSQARAAFDAEVARLGEIEALETLDAPRLTGVPAAASANYASLSEMQARIEVITAKRNALERGLVSSGDVLLEVREQVRIARDHLIEQQRSTFKAEFDVALRTLISVLRRVAVASAALGKGTGDLGLAPDLYTLEIRDPFSVVHKDLLFGSKFDGKHLSDRDVDPSLAKLYESLSPAAHLAAEIAEEIKPIKEKRDAAQREANRQAQPAGEYNNMGCRINRPHEYNNMGSPIG